MTIADPGVQLRQRPAQLFLRARGVAGGRVQAGQVDEVLHHSGLVLQRVAAQRQRAFEHQPRRVVLAGLVLAAPELRIERSEEHTSELQSLMRNSSAVFCLKQKNKNNM